MPAHLRDKAGCNAEGCARVATADLYNTRNEITGSYCDRHKREALRTLQHHESAAHQERLLREAFGDRPKGTQ